MKVAWWGSGKMRDLQYSIICFLLSAVSVFSGWGGGAESGELVPSGSTKCSAGGTVAARISVY